MRRNQWLVVLGGIVAVIALYAFGRRVSQAGSAPAVQAAMQGAQMNQAKAASFDDILGKAKSALDPQMQMRISKLEHSVTRGEVKRQQLQAYRSLAALWDSLGHIPIAAHYTGEQGRLEGSEQTLTFAANLLLTHHEHAKDPAVKAWEVEEAKGFLEKAVKIAPNNDTIQVVLAKSEVASGNVMQGVQRLLKITGKDPDNMEAQMTLGQLSITSGQFLKAIDHLKRVVDRQPDNVEAMYYLAEAYKNTGKTKEAISLFERCKQLVNDPGFSKEIDNYIDSFK